MSQDEFWQAAYLIALHGFVPYHGTEGCEFAKRVADKAVEHAFGVKTENVPKKG